MSNENQWNEQNNNNNNKINKWKHYRNHMKARFSILPERIKYLWCLNTHFFFSKCCFRLNRFPCWEFKSQYILFTIIIPEENSMVFILSRFFTFYFFFFCVFRPKREKRHLTIKFLVLFLLHFARSVHFIFQYILFAI